MTPVRKFWPLDYDQEVEIYDNLSWDLPGRTRRPGTLRVNHARRPAGMRARQAPTP
jgi:hypothetical protein